MENQINTIRADINRIFDEKKIIPEIEEIHFSPDKKNYFKSTYYLMVEKTHTWTASKIEIYESHSNNKIFEFIRNDDSIFHGWLTIDGNCYLLLSEDMEGKSVFDINNRRLNSVAFENDKFIWCEYYPSPDSKRLAVVGCYWACPYEIRIFDTSNPNDLPYRELYNQETLQDKIEWTGERTLKIENINGTLKTIEIK